MVDDRRKGIGRASMDVRTGGQDGRPTPSPAQQNSLFYIGVVMDDSDDQRMGRLMVYVPGLSSKRFGEHSTPDYGGTTPDRETGRLVIDPALRTGWYPCYPLLAFAGTDFFRVSNSPTGRNGREGGHSNSYGTWYQPRIGDHVGILFAGADPGQGYWIGCVPKFYSNFSMPGVSGVQKSTLGQQENASVYDDIPDNGLTPSLDRINENGQSERFRNTFAATDFTNNLLEAGLIADPLRGSSVSSARRESPSYVMGMKSPGWDFDSEKNKVNAETGLKFDNTRVGDAPSVQDSPYKDISTVGHQFVMDDHPDYQGVRLRTSAGSQLYFNDTSATEPFIYISTAKGNVWIEMRDDGKLDIFTNDDISAHAGGDLNLVADGNMNIEVGGNLRTLVKGNSEMQVGGTTSWQMDSRFTIQANRGMDIDVIGSFLQNSSEETAFGAAGGTFYIQSSGTMNFDTNGQINMSAIQGIGLDGTQGVRVQSASGIVLNGGGEVRASAGAIWLNSGAGAPPTPATSGPGPSVIPLSQGEMLPGAPTPAQIRSGEQPDPVLTIASRLPQHQPWSLRSAATRGFNGFVDEDDAPASTPQGAARVGAKSALNIVGFIGGGAEARIYQGQDYQTESLAETPQYDDLGEPASDELKDVDELSASDRLVRYLHTKEGLVTRRAYLDAGVAWAIGYGHNIKIGDVINGERVDSDYIAELNRTKGKSLRITKEEADRIFRIDLQKFEEAIRRNVNVPITQGQFDAMVSLTYNIGEGNLQRSGVLRETNNKNFQNVPREWVKWRKSRNKAGVRVVNKGLQTRRQEELELFWAASEATVSSATA